MLKYSEQCCSWDIQCYLAEYPQLDGSNPSKQMVNKPLSRLDILDCVNKQSTENNMLIAAGSSNPTPGASPSSASPVSVTGIFQSNTPTSGAFSGTPDESNNMVVKGQVQEMSTTVFVDNAETAQKDESQVTHVDPRWYSINDTQQTEQSIKDFLAKPIVIESGAFSIADTLTTILGQYMPLSALQTSAMWRDKLKGFFGIRMDMRFRLVVNANRFQQGRYILAWVPFGGMEHGGSLQKADLRTDCMMATLVQRTTVPHVELDISTQTSCELLVPFASIHNFYPLSTIATTDARAMLGKIIRCPYSPLVAPTGSTVATFTLYCSFENVTLFGAASPQGLDQEISHKSNGPISGVAAAFARGFTEISTIPLLSSYAKGAAWISDRIAKTAKVFGFSKPTQGDSIGKVEILNNPGHSNVDGDSDVRTLSYLAKPSTVPLDGMSGTAFDEMDFSYIARKFAWFNTYPWTTGGLVGGDIFSVSVFPYQFRDLGTARHYLPVGFITSFFKQWRGSMKFRLKFVKTEFHSGRLAVMFFPSDDIATYGASPEYVNRHIIDIREYNEFTFEVPFISRYAWNGVDDRCGVFAVRIVDPLVAPSSVSASISIILEIAGGDDLQWAIPSTNEYQPLAFVPQSGLADPNKISMNIGNSSTMGDPITASAITIGDTVTSFRALCKRYYPLFPNNKLVANTVSRANSLIMDLFVDLIPVRNIAPNTATYYTNCDVIGAIASCYTFWGGGVRIKDVTAVGLAATPGNQFSSNMATVGFYPATANVNYMMKGTNPPSTTTVPNQHMILQQIFQNGTITFEVPQYTRGLKRCIPDAWLVYYTPPDTDLDAKGLNLTQGFVRVALPTGLGTPAAIDNYDLHNFYRSLSDDGEFSLFVAVPPMGGVQTSAIYPFY